MVADVIHPFAFEEGYELAKKADPIEITYGESVHTVYDLTGDTMSVVDERVFDDPDFMQGLAKGLAARKGESQYE